VCKDINSMQRTTRSVNNTDKYDEYANPSVLILVLQHMHYLRNAQLNRKHPGHSKETAKFR
jgi:hypothetical protein